MRANIDRAVINPEISGNVRLKDGKLTTDQILECKTANAYLAKLWGENDDEIPDYYMTQCQWYMGITGAEICHLAVLIGGQDFRTYRILFDQELFDMLFEECRKFWFDHVLADVPPALTTFDDIAHKWQKHEDGKTLTADSNLLEILKSEIAECRIRAKSNETIQVLSHLQEFAENNLNNGWISVDDKLPTENQLVLLFDNFNEITIGKIIKKCNAHKAHDYALRTIDDEFIFWLITTSDDYHYGTYHDIGLISDFTHWQPLPQPPQE